MAQRRRLRDIQRTNQPLNRVYLLKETVAKALISLLFLCFGGIEVKPRLP